MHKQLQDEQVSEAQYTDRMKEIAATLDFEQLSVRDISDMGNGWFFFMTGTEARVVARLEAIAKRPDQEGMAAAAERIRLMPRADWAMPEVIDLLRGVLKHPGWRPGAAGPGDLGLAELCGFLRFRMESEHVAFLLPELEEVARVLIEDERPRAGEVCGWLVRVVTSVRLPEIHSAFAALIERARLKAVDAASRGTATSGSEMERKAALAFLETDMARQRFFDSPAPELKVRWSSDASVRSLRDLRGKVVVCEFWSTSCGPCVGTLPAMESLKKEFAGQPVAFVMVTGASNEAGADLPNPSKEELEASVQAMGPFMREHAVTSTVWMTDGGCYEPLFGIASNPSVVILDAQGLVREYGLHPARPARIRKAIAAWAHEKTP